MNEKELIADLAQRITHQFRVYHINFYFTDPNRISYSTALANSVKEARKIILNSYPGAVITDVVVGQLESDRITGPGQKYILR